MTAERFAAAAKIILDEDRRADRERIAELERDAAQWHIAANATIDKLNKQLNEITEKCAALVVENKRLREDDEPEHKPLDVAAMSRVLDECGVAKPERYDNSTLRIDPDMSDPQPGKLLVVRIDDEDVDHMGTGCLLRIGRRQFVGFLVETPAVEVKRTPKVGDRVRFVDGSHHQGIIGEVLFKYDGDAFMVGQGSLKYCGKAADLEVIE